MKIKLERDKSKLWTELWKILPKDTKIQSDDTEIIISGVELSDVQKKQILKILRKAYPYAEEEKM